VNSDELSYRLLELAVRIMRVAHSLPRTREGQHIADQLLRAGTSPGANYEEACGAESRRDFTHKIGIVLKELKETRYWLRLAGRALLVKPAKLDSLLGELEQVIAIFGKSVRTSKRSPRSMPNA